jgi:hypothetical protein
MAGDHPVGIVLFHFPSRRFVHWQLSIGPQITLLALEFRAPLPRLVSFFNVVEGKGGPVFD